MDQYERKADDYMAAQAAFYSRFPDKSREIFYDQIGSALTGKRLLDIGCGFAKDLMYFQKAGAEVYGIDASPRMIHLAQQSHPSLENLSVESFEATHFDNSFFDIVISRYALHYAHNLTQAFREIHRILKPSGTCVLLVAHPLLAFISRKERIYHKPEVVDVAIYDGAVTIREPTRTFSEYLNDFVLKNFVLETFYESPGLENQPREATSTEIVPDFLLLKLRKT